MKPMTILSQIRKPASALSAAALAMSLAACGAQTNPMADYGDLRQEGPKQTAAPKPEYEPDQVCIEPKMENGANLAVLNFTVNKSARYVITSGCSLDGVQYELVAKGLPADSSFQRDPSNPNQYILEWTPKKDVAPSGGEKPEEYPVSVEYQITAFPKDALGMKSTQGKAYAFKLSVAARQATPQITAVRVASREITQGEKVAITVEAQDSSAVSGQSPVLEISDESAGQGSGVPAAKLVTFEAASLAGEGKFIFSGVLDTSGLVWPSKKGAVITARFSIALRTADGRRSSQAQVDVKVMKKTEAAAEKDEPRKAAPKKKKGGKK